jgi:hypothetical protein
MTKFESKLTSFLGTTQPETNYIWVSGTYQTQFFSLSYVWMPSRRHSSALAFMKMHMLPGVQKMDGGLLYF